MMITKQLLQVSLLVTIVAIISVSYTLASTTRAGDGSITPCSVNNIKIGDNADKIHKELQSKYTLATTKEHDTLKEVAVLKGKKVVMSISLKENKIFLINVYASYSTEKNIHPGSKLSSVLAAYGTGKINPTDSGYFVFFEKTPGIQFLIDNKDIPGKLRDIPDDALNQEQENQILRLKNANISAIQIFCNHD